MLHFSTSCAASVYHHMHYKFYEYYFPWIFINMCQSVSCPHIFSHNWQSNCNRPHQRIYAIRRLWTFTAQQRAVLRHLTFNRHVFRSEEHYRPRCIAIRSPSEVIGWGNVTLSMTLKQLTASSITRMANVHVLYRCRVFLEPKQQIFLQCFNSLRIHISFSAEIPEVKLAAVFPQPARTANTWCIEPGRVIDEVVNGNDQTNTIFNYTSTFSCWIMIHLNKGIWKTYVKQQWFESEFSIFFLPFKSLNSSRKD